MCNTLEHLFLAHGLYPGAITSTGYLSRSPCKEAIAKPALGRHNVLGNQAGIVSNSVEKPGLRRGKPRQADKIQTRKSRNATRLDRKAVSVQHGQLHQGEVKGIARRPNHVGDAARREVKVSDERSLKAVAQRLQSFIWGNHPGPGDVIVNRFDEIGFVGVRACQVVVQVRCQLELAVLDALKMPKQ